MLNQVAASAVLVRTRVGVGCSVSRAHKTLSGSFLLKDFLCIYANEGIDATGTGRLAGAKVYFYVSI